MARECYNGTLLANDCEQTRLDGKGCDSEGMCMYVVYLTAIRSANKPRPDYRGCDNKGG